MTVTFQRAFQPSAGLSYWKIGTRQMCMKWLLIIGHVKSVEQCRTVSTVIARCYLHLRWYFLKKTENYSWSISCHVTEGQSHEFISFFAIEYNIRLWDGPEPFGKIPDPRWHISLAKKGALNHISFRECFLLLVFSNKHWGLNKNLRVTTGVMSACAMVHFIERVIWKGLPGRWNIEEESKIALTILNCPIWFVSWSLSV